jgi:hypothetical protein
MALNLVEVEYVKLLEPELKAAIESGEPNRAASFAKELARLRRKEKTDSGNHTATEAVPGGGQ